MTTRDLFAVGVLAALLAGGVVTLGSTTRGEAANLPLSTQRLTTYQLRTCVLSADAYVSSQNSETTTNFGTATTTRAGVTGVNVRRSFLRADLATCLPAGGTVTSARLVLTVTAAPGNPRTHSLHRASAPWTETAITWNSQPAVAATATASATVTTASTSTSYDVTADVNAFQSGTLVNNGWRIRDDAEGGANGSVEYASKEVATGIPVLEVTY